MLTPIAHRTTRTTRRTPPRLYRALSRTRPRSRTLPRYSRLTEASPRSNPCSPRSPPSCSRASRRRTTARRSTASTRRKRRLRRCLLSVILTRYRYSLLSPSPVSKWRGRVHRSSHRARCEIRRRCEEKGLCRADGPGGSLILCIPLCSFPVSAVPSHDTRPYLQPPCLFTPESITACG